MIKKHLILCGLAVCMGALTLVPELLGQTPPKPATPGKSGSPAQPASQKVTVSAVAVNPDMSKADESDNLWDGVNKAGELQVFVEKGPILPSKISYTNDIPPSVQLSDMNGDGLNDIIAADSRGYFWVFPNGGTAKEPKFTHGEILPIFIYDAALWPAGVDEKKRSAMGKKKDDDDHDNSSAWREEQTFPRIYCSKGQILIGTYHGQLFKVNASGSGGKVSVSAHSPVTAEVKTTPDQNRFFWGNYLAPGALKNASGTTDIVIGDGSFSASSIWLFPTGSVSVPRVDFARRRQLVMGQGRTMLIPAAADWDNDGKEDLIVAGSSDGSPSEVLVYLNKGEGNFGITSPYAASKSDQGTPGEQPDAVVSFGAKTSLPTLSTIAVGDLNGDSLFDMLVGDTKGKFSISLNAGQPGKPVFGALKGVMGTDKHKPYKRALGWNSGYIYWTDKADSHYTETPYNLYNPYGVIEQVVDPADDKKPLSPDRTNKECLKFYYMDPNNDYVTGDYPVNAMNKPVQLQLGETFQIYAKGSPVVDSGKYQLTYMVKGSGFKTVQAKVNFDALRSKAAVRVDRRGNKQATSEGTGFKDIPIVKPLTLPADWRKETIKIDVVPKTSTGVAFSLLLEGKGEIYLDDVKVESQ